MSRGNQILRREWEQGKNVFPCSADHVQFWQKYPVDPYSAESTDHTYMLYRVLKMLVGKIVGGDVVKTVEKKHTVH